MIYLFKLSMATYELVNASETFNFTSVFNRRSFVSIALIILNSFEISLGNNMSNFSRSQNCICKILFYKISIMS